MRCPAVLFLVTADVLCQDEAISILQLHSRVEPGMSAWGDPSRPHAREAQPDEASGAPTASAGAAEPKTSSGELHVVADEPYVASPEEPRTPIGTEPHTVPEATDAHSEPHAVPEAPEAHSEPHAVPEAPDAHSEPHAVPDSGAADDSSDEKVERPTRAPKEGYEDAHPANWTSDKYIYLETVAQFCIGPGFVLMAILFFSILGLWWSTYRNNPRVFGF